MLLNCTVFFMLQIYMYYFFHPTYINEIRLNNRNICEYAVQSTVLTKKWHYNHNESRIYCKTVA